MSDQCKDCRFFYDRGMGDHSGYCRRYPPAVMERLEGKEFWRWPIVSVADWCGEWEQAAYTL